MFRWAVLRWLFSGRPRLTLSCPLSLFPFSASASASASAAATTLLTSRAIHTASSDHSTLASPPRP